MVVVAGIEPIHFVLEMAGGGNRTDTVHAVYEVGGNRTFVVVVWSEEGLLQALEGVILNLKSKG